MNLEASTQLLLYALLTILAALVTWRNREHVWLAAYVAWMLSSDLIRMLLERAGARTRGPVLSVAGIARQLDDLLVLSWSFLFVACCVHYFARRRPAAVIVVWILTWIASNTVRLVAGRGYDLYLMVGIACSAASWALILHGVLRRKDLDPGLAHLVLILYAGTDIVLYLVPLKDHYLEHWPLVRLANHLLLIVCCVAHVWWLVRGGPRIPPPRRGLVGNFRQEKSSFNDRNGSRFDPSVVERREGRFTDEQLRETRTREPRPSLTGV